MNPPDSTMTTFFLTLSHYIPLLLLPVGYFFCALVTALLIKAKFARIAKFALASGVIYLLLVSLPLVSNALVASLESRYPQPQFEDLEKADVLVLLGGGVNLPDLPRQFAELGPGADRLLLAHRLFNAGKTERIWLSGGNLLNDDGKQSEASLTKAILQSWGIPSEHILLEESSRNTAENALYFANAAEENQWESILLVTSASHMPRAMEQFQRLGIKPVPLSADHWVTREEPRTVSLLIPQADALNRGSKAIREYIGRAVYQYL